MNNNMMKRLFCLLALGVALSACEKDSVEEIDPNTRTVTFCANFDETRTFLLNKTFYWDEDDAIGGFAENNNNVKFTTVQEEEGAKTGYFSGQITGEPTPQFYLYYPYQKNASFAGTTLTMELPQTQKLIANSTHDVFPMVATTSNFDELVRFRNIAGVLRLTVKSNIARTITSLTFTATDENAVVWGTGTVDMADMSDEAKPALKMNSVAGHNSVTLTGNVKVEAGKETYFYVVLPPATYTNGFTVTLSDGTNEVEAVYNTKDLPMERNKLMAVSTPIEFNSKGTIVLNSITISDLAGATIYFSQETMTGEVKLNGFTNPKAVKLVLDYDAETDNGGDVTPEILIDGEPYSENGTYDFTKPVTITLISEELEFSAEYTAKLSQLNDTGLPVVYVNTPSEITSKDVWTPADDKTATDDQFCYIYIDAEGRQSWDGSVNFKDFAEAKCSVKGRGNSTWAWNKKPYAIKLDKKAEVLGMPEHKRWVLLANAIDKSMMRNSVAFEIAKVIYNRNGVPNGAGNVWTPRGHSVELVLNGEHLGNYLLCEQIKIDENRVNAGKFESEDTRDGQGYLIECDRLWGSDPTETLWWNSYRRQTGFGQWGSFSDYRYYYTVNVDGVNIRTYRDEYNLGGFTFANVAYSTYNNDASIEAGNGYGMTFGLKDPDDGDLKKLKDSEAYKFINEFVTKAEKVIFDEHDNTPEHLNDIAKYIDLNSFVDYYLINELTMNHELNNAGSVYMYYTPTSDGGKLYAGPVWDYDWTAFKDAAGRGNNGLQFIVGNSLWYVRLLQIDAFQTMVKTRWTDVKTDLTALAAKIHTMQTYLEKSAEYNWEELWTISSAAGTDPNKENGISYDEAAQDIYDNVLARMGYMSTLIEAEMWY